MNYKKPNAYYKKRLYYKQEKKISKRFVLDQKLNKKKSGSKSKKEKSSSNSLDNNNTHNNLNNSDTHTFTKKELRYLYIYLNRKN